MRKDPVRAIKDKLKGYSRLVALGLTILLIVSLVRNIRKTLEAEDRIGRKEVRGKRGGDNSCTPRRRSLKGACS